MPIEYEMMHLKKTVDEAIQDFFKDVSFGEHMFRAEDIVLDILENDPLGISKFQDYQIIAMRELLYRGYWLKWDDELGRTMLKRLNR